MAAPVEDDVRVVLPDVPAGSLGLPAQVGCQVDVVLPGNAAQHLHQHSAGAVLPCHTIGIKQEYCVSNQRN